MLRTVPSFCLALYLRSASSHDASRLPGRTHDASLRRRSVQQRAPGLTGPHQERATHPESPHRVARVRMSQVAALVIRTMFRWLQPGHTCTHVSRKVDIRLSRKVDIRLPGKGNSNSHGARPVHQNHRWIRTSRLSIKNSLFMHPRGCTWAARKLILQEKSSSLKLATKFTARML